MLMFPLGSNAKVNLNNVVGEVIGRAEYINGSPDSYWLYYLNSDGDACKSWFDEQELTQFIEE